MLQNTFIRSPCVRASIGPLRLSFSAVSKCFEALCGQYWLLLVGKKKETNIYGKNALEEERTTLVNQLNNQNFVVKAKNARQ